MGKGYPMWVKDTYEHGTTILSYRARCTSHENETRFHSDAKRRFADHCRTLTTPYQHNKVYVSSQKSEIEMDGGLVMNGY
ncbi:hypothetical protein [Erythrobacter sp. EC-HK427]|uniref:hypothetical protein n=1 Tax=Erythrobacter sp. EC-HK427 TaxID=2038396 RepID=UPI001256F69D|nr:hypothetical protein [Erythrobacter sp. EC-HK427]VVT05703.1 hypothetical protein ERY430_41264 [Erythrobacter sp. EC-HK427]